MTELEMLKKTVLVGYEEHVEAVADMETQAIVAKLKLYDGTILDVSVSNNKDINEMRDIMEVALTRSCLRHAIKGNDA